MADRLQLIFDMLGGKDSLNPSLEKAKKNTQSVEFGISSIGKAIAAAGAAFASFAVVSRSINFVENSIQAAIEAEDAVNGLNAALAASGQYSKEASDGLKDFAESIQNTTRFSDDAVIKATALASSLTGLGQNQLKQVVTAATNLSAAIGIDLETAVTTVSKAIEGSSGALQRYGIKIQLGKDETQNFAQVIGILNERFGGRAQADVNTYSGRIAQLKNLFDNVKEEIGGLIVNSDSLKGFLSTLPGLIRSASEALKNFGASGDVVFDIIATFAAAGRAITKVFLGIPEVIVNVFELIYQYAYLYAQKIGNSFNGITSKLLNFIGISKKFTTEAEILAAANVKETESFIERIKNSISSGGEFAEGKAKFFDNVVDSIITGSAKIKQAGKSLQNGIQNNVKTGIENAIKDLEYPLSRILFSRKQLQDAITGLEISFGLKLNFEKVSRAIEDIFKNAGGFIAAGADGARNLLVSGAKAAGNYFVDGLGDAIAPIIDMFAKGAAFTRQQVQDFATGLVDAVLNIIDVATQGEEIIFNAFQKGIERFGERMPEIAANFGKSLSAQGPLFIQQLYIQLAKQAPSLSVELAKSFAKGLEEGFKEFIKNVGNIGSSVGSFFSSSGSGGSFLGGVGNAIGGAVGAVGDFFGFAKGGVVPDGYAGPKDTYPALLQSGERVLTVDQNKNLEAVANGGNDLVIGLLSQILTALQRPQTVTTQVQIGNKVLADAILELNRTNARLYS